MLPPAWTRALGACVEVTAARYAEGRHVCDATRGRLRYELRLTWLGGRRILDRVDAQRGSLLQHRPVLGAADVPCAGVALRDVEGRRGLMARKTSFYYAFLVLPAEQRRAIIAVWDFCRAVDDAVDEADKPQRPDAREAICFWRAELARCYEGAAPQTAQGRRLQPFIIRFDLPRQAFADVIDGVAMDLDTTRYQTFDDLLQYCLRVASAVGLICIRIFGCRDPRARDYALNLGVALQLTNILRDIKDDLARGRVYLPLDDLAAAGCTVADLAAGE